MSNNQKLKKIILKELDSILNEDESNLTYKFKIEGIEFNAHFDVNKNPTKKGIKIQLKPLTKLTDVNRNELINRIQDSLNKKLDEYELELDYDQDVPDKSVIGFYIKLGDLSDFFIRAFNK